MMLARLITFSIFASFYLAPLIATVVIANKKERSWPLWLLFAVFFPILALLLVSVLAPMVPCKQCAECHRFSRASTLACPYCNRPMPEGPIENAPDPAAGNRMTAVVVAIVVVFVGIAMIGILAAIAIPRFASLVSKSQEGRTKANLGVVRAGLSIYYGDTSGHYPRTLDALTQGGKYIVQIPAVDLPRTINNIGHPASANVTYASSSGGPTDTGGWFYDDRPGNGNGQIAINCTHQDMKGKRWDSY